jgi:hypothetical protein
MGERGRKLGNARTGLAVAVLAVTAVTATVLPQMAFGEERSCRGQLGRTTVDNLRVPQQAMCVLTGTRVQGVITVQRGATLIANGIRVIGNVQAENARNVVVRRSSRIGGSIQLKQGGRASVLASRINGDLHYDANRGYLRAHRNRVGGSIQVVGNSGGASIVRNVVDGNLECKENRPPPTGRRNVVGESKLDQCARL